MDRVPASTFVDIHPNSSILWPGSHPVVYHELGTGSVAKDSHPGSALSGLYSKAKAAAGKGEPKRLRCPLCPFVGARTDAFRKHLDAVHGDDRPHECPHCDKCFKQKEKLSRHVACVHDKLKPFTCDLCHATFSRKDKLKRHVSSIHLKERPYVCNHCDHRSSRRDRMRHHVTTVHAAAAAAGDDFEYRPNDGPQ